MRGIAFTLALAVAVPAYADDGIALGIVAHRTPEKVLAVFMKGCMSDRFLVEESTPTTLICSKVMTGGRGFAAQLLIGNAYSTPPKDKMRFNAVAVGEDTQLQIQHTIETQMAFGQMKVVPAGGKQLQVMLNGMIERTRLADEAEKGPPPQTRVTVSDLGSRAILPSETLAQERAATMTKP